MPRRWPRSSAAPTRLRIFLANPQVPTETKMELINRTLGPKFSPLVIRLIELMIDRERIDVLPDVLAEIQRLVEHAEGIYQAEIDSAMELDFQDKLRLKNALEKYTGYKLKIDYNVEPNLIGGLVFRFRDTLIDGSLRSGLNKLRRRLLETALPQG